MQSTHLKVALKEIDVKGKPMKPGKGLENSCVNSYLASLPQNVFITLSNCKSATDSIKVA